MHSLTNPTNLNHWCLPPLIIIGILSDPFPPTYTHTHHTTPSPRLHAPPLTTHPFSRVHQLLVVLDGPAFAEIGVASALDAKKLQVAVSKLVSGGVGNPGGVAQAAGSGIKAVRSIKEQGN